MSSSTPDALVVGAGPNGLAAAITIAMAGRSVVVYEAATTPGGGARSAELTLPGFSHDPCSAIHPTALASPFFSSLDLGRHGLEWIESPAPLAHPLDGGRAAVLERSVADTAATLEGDGRAWRRTFGPLVRAADGLVPELLGPIVHVPRHPIALARFGLPALRTATGFGRSTFDGDGARALFGGMAAHSMRRARRPLTAAFGLVLGLFAHASAGRWPRGGSAADRGRPRRGLRELGGEIVTGHRVASIAELPTARAVLFDVTPRQLIAIAGDRLPAGYRRRLEGFRYGPGVFKVDWALTVPSHGRPAGRREPATVHLGGTLDEIAASEDDVAAGPAPGPSVRPVRPADARSTRRGRRPASTPPWAYCHVPNGSTVDMTDADRGPGRTVRPRVPRPRPRPQRMEPGRARGVQREPHRWRHQRRDPGLAAAHLQANSSLAAASSPKTTVRSVPVRASNREAPS